MRANGIVRRGTTMSKREGRGENHGGKKAERDKKNKREGITELELGEGNLKIDSRR